MVVAKTEPIRNPLATNRTPSKNSRPASANTRHAWLITGALVAIIAVVVVVLLATRSTTSTPASAPESVSDQDASASLVQAADRVGFHPTTEPGVGQMEGKPASAAEPPSNPNLLRVGAVAPDFVLKTPQGQRVGLSEYRGKVVLLEFFATWCPHCNAEAPHLRQLYAALPKGIYSFLSINADGETAPSVFAFHRYYGLQYPALVDPSSNPGSFATQGSAGSVTNQYHVVSYPTFYVLDPQGRVLWRGDGEQPDALLLQELHKAAGRD
jgi:peroxiredoxin